MKVKESAQWKLLMTQKLINVQEEDGRTARKRQKHDLGFPGLGSVMIESSVPQHGFDHRPIRTL